MFNLGVTLLLIALIAAVLGFGGIALAAAEIAKVVFFVALAVPRVRAVRRGGRAAASPLTIACGACAPAI